MTCNTDTINPLNAKVFNLIFINLKLCLADTIHNTEVNYFLIFLFDVTFDY